MARSPFFHTAAAATVDSLAILHLKRDSLQPIQLKSTANDGYAEGAVTNTRFGSYPHSTLIGATWGSQIRASKVDTGTRGRKGRQAPEPAVNDDLAPKSLKRKSSTDGDVGSAKRQKQSSEPSRAATPIQADSGFTHILQPTPESWTSSLDHRTQVVYVPDYSYVLSRLGVKPGDSMIEAGAGSGSFTHAAARAVFNGYPEQSDATGRVYSFEYHKPRAETLRVELAEHQLDTVVTLTHRDVCNDGFALADVAHQNVVAVFLDLPAPWEALKHLTRDEENTPLARDAPVRICTFSPCIEQVSMSVAALRSAGWTNIAMFEVANRRIDVRRERVGLNEAGLRGVNAVPATVEESLERLREVEVKLQHFQKGDKGAERSFQTKAERLEANKRAVDSRKLYKEGNLIHRTESEVKTHTSYLVFAVLPMAWTDEDEQALVKV